MAPPSVSQGNVHAVTVARGQSLVMKVGESSHRADSMGRWVEPHRLSKIPTWFDPDKDPFENYLRIVRYALESVLLLCSFYSL